MLERLLAEPLRKKPGQKVTPREAVTTLSLVFVLAALVVALIAACDRVLL